MVENLSIIPMKQEKNHMSKFIKEMKAHGPLYAMFLPGIVFLVIFSYIPMAGVLLAFKNINYRDGIINSPWVGLENMKMFFNSPDAGIMIRNTLLYNVAFIALGLVFQISFAIILNELRNRLAAKFYHTVMFLPYFLSWVVIGMVLYTFLNPSYGFINTTILPLLKKAPIDWYANPKFWPFIIVFLNIIKGTGYGAIVYLAAITGIDTELFDAAIVDGANKRQQIFNITLPAIKPLVIILTILAIGGIFNSDFGLFYNVTMNQGLLYKATNVIDLYTYNAFMVTGNLSVSTAAGLLKSVLGFILILSTNLVVKKISPENTLL